MSNATRVSSNPFDIFVVGAIFDKTLDGVFRVSVVATGLESLAMSAGQPMETNMDRH